MGMVARRLLPPFLCSAVEYPCSVPPLSAYSFNRSEGPAHSQCRIARSEKLEQCTWRDNNSQATFTLALLATLCPPDAALALEHRKWAAPP